MSAHRSEVHAYFTLPCGCTISNKAVVEGAIRDEEEAKRILTFGADILGHWVEKRGIPHHTCDRRRQPFEPVPRSQGGQAIQSKPGPVPQNGTSVDEP